MSRYIGRIAPSPTGLLHLGHAATFWRAFERAREHAGMLFFRNDDLDRTRVRAELVTAMVEDLRWLGIRWTEPVVAQSERLPLYRAAMLRLLRSGAVYPCTCSRREVAGMISAPHEDAALPHDDEPVYPGRCRPTAARPASTNELLPGVNYRFRVPDFEPVTFDDLACGPQHFVPGCTTAIGDIRGADFGDFLVWRRDGLPSYQLASVVDDAALGVTEVVRGRDLLKSTARQLLLQRALGVATPAWLHTPLLTDAAGQRLAKRYDALALRTMRSQGLTPERVRALWPANPALESQHDVTRATKAR